MSELVSWKCTLGRRTKGHPKKTFVDLLQHDTGYTLSGIESHYQAEKTFCQLPYPRRQRPTGKLGCGQRNGNWPPADCVNISPHHPGAVQDQTFHGKPGSNSIGYTLELSASMLICGDGAYPRVQPVTTEQTSRQQITSSRSAPIPSTKWSPWLDWCWFRFSNSWVATKQVPRDLFLLVIGFHTKEEVPESKIRWSESEWLKWSCAGMQGESKSWNLQT